MGAAWARRRRGRQLAVRGCVRVPARDRDAFVEEYVARGGQLIPPEHRTGLLQHYDQYDASYRALSPEVQVAVRRNNTLAYLARWGLDIAALSGALARLGYLTAAPPDEYCEEIAEALRRFQADQMMRQIDGFFGDLTYRQMVGLLLERGLATAPARTPR